MPNKLKKLESQIARLQAEADKLRREEANGVIARIKAAIAHYGFTAADLGFGDASTGRQSSRKAAPKARGVRVAALTQTPGSSADAAPGEVAPRKARKLAKQAAARVRYSDGTNTWSGFGRKPGWLTAALADGKTLEQLVVTG